MTDRGGNGQPCKDAIARIIDPRPFERSKVDARYGDVGRRLQAMRKAEQIMAHLKRIGTSEEAETLAEKSPKTDGDA